MPYVGNTIGNTGNTIGELCFSGALLLLMDQNKLLSSSPALTPVDCSSLRHYTFTATITI